MRCPMANNRIIATTSRRKSCSIYSGNSDLYGKLKCLINQMLIDQRLANMLRCSQIRQGIAGNTKGTAFVVYEDVTDAKQACDKLNGFNFQSRYLVGK